MVTKMSGHPDFKASLNHVQSCFRPQNVSVDSPVLLFAVPPAVFDARYKSQQRYTQGAQKNVAQASLLYEPQSPKKKSFAVM